MLWDFSSRSLCRTSKIGLRTPSLSLCIPSRVEYEVVISTLFWIILSFILQNISPSCLQFFSSGPLFARRGVAHPSCSAFSSCLNPSCQGKTNPHATILDDRRYLFSSQSSFKRTFTVFPIPVNSVTFSIVTIHITYVSLLKNHSALDCL